MASTGSLTDLTAAIDFSTLEAAIITVGIALVGVAVVSIGVRSVLRHIRGGA